VTNEDKECLNSELKWVTFDNELQVRNSKPRPRIGDLISSIDRHERNVGRIRHDRYGRIGADLGRGIPQF
jgi:hypothetical protein